MKKTTLSLIIVAAFPLLAQDFNTYLDNAKKAYADKDYELAKLELQDALKRINDNASAALGNTFPKAPAGWQTEEQRTVSNPMAGSEISQLYKNGDAAITAKITHNSPLLASYAAMFNNPMLMQGEKVRIGREHAMLKMNDDGKSGELTYLVKGKYLIQITGNGLSDKQVIIDLIKAWDIATIKKMSVE